MWCETTRETKQWDVQLVAPLLFSGAGSFFTAPPPQQSRALYSTTHCTCFYLLSPPQTPLRHFTLLKKLRAKQSPVSLRKKFLDHANCREFGWRSVWLLLAQENGVWIFTSCGINTPLKASWCLFKTKRRTIHGLYEGKTQSVIYFKGCCYWPDRVLI